MAKCRHCGAINVGDAKYCRNCGNSLGQEQKSSGGCGKSVLAVLGILLALGVIYALKGGFGEVNKEEESGLFDDTTTVVEEDNNILPEPVKKLLDDMVYVEGGSFMMLVDVPKSEDDEYDSSNDFKIIEERTEVSSFYISKYEVTQELWLAVMGNNPSHFSSGCGYSDDLLRPVENFSWKECQDFIEKLNKLTGEYFRLPSCAEWQYAAKGGNLSKGYKYAGSNNLDEVAWMPEVDEKFITHAVGKKKGNELQLYDMNGNVAEVVSDRYYISDAVYQYTCGSSIQDLFAKWDGSVKANNFNKMGLEVRSGEHVWDHGSMFIGLRLAMAVED